MLGKLAVALAIGMLAPATLARADMADPLFRVQSEVHNRLRYQAEGEGKDNWRIPTRYADCEDYALLKRQILISKYGYASEDVELLILIKRSDVRKDLKNSAPSYNAHVVVRIKSADLVLNNPSSETPREVSPPINYIKFMKDGRWQLWCVVGDISMGNKETAKRCVHEKGTG